MRVHNIRILAIFLTVSLLSLKGYTQENKAEKLKGRVKSITLLAYDAVEKQGEAPKDQLAGKSKFLYDEKNNLIESNFYDIKSDLVISRDKRIYDGNGNMVEILFYDRTGEISKYVYKYDNYNHEIEKKTYWKGRFDGKVITSYDYIKMIVKVFYYKADGSLQSNNSYKIDEKGNHVEDYGFDGKIISKSKYKYDVKGRIENEFWESWEDGHTKGILKLEYDEMDNEIRRVNKDITGKTISVVSKKEIEYDKLGNWIKIVQTWPYNSTRTTQKREIEYY